MMVMMMIGGNDWIVGPIKNEDKRLIEESVIVGLWLFGGQV